MSWDKRGGGPEESQQLVRRGGKWRLTERLAAKKTLHAKSTGRSNGKERWTWQRLCRNKGEGIMEGGKGKRRARENKRGFTAPGRPRKKGVHFGRANSVEKDVEVRVRVPGGKKEGREMVA